MVLYGEAVELIIREFDAKGRVLVNGSQIMTEKRPEQKRMRGP